MLTFSPVFPRSIRFAIGEVDTALARIAASRAYDPEYGGHDGHLPPDSLRGETDEATRAVGRLRSQLTYGVIEEIFASGLHTYLLDVQHRCYQIGEHIQAQYFATRILRPEEVVT